MSEVDAADQRLRTWLRKSGKNANYGKKGYGAVPDDEENESLSYSMQDDQNTEKISSMPIRMARKCRKAVCTLLAVIALVACVMLMVYVYIIASPDDVSFVTLGDWGCGPDNCKVPASAPDNFKHGGQNALNVAEAMSRTAKAIGAKFVLALGDNFYWRGVQSVADPLWKSVWEDRFNQPSLNVPWYAILGNHDHYGNPEAQIDFSRQDLDCKGFKNCPGRWTLPRYWYSVVHPSSRGTFDVQFVFIDTVILSEGSSRALAEEKARMGVVDPKYLKKWDDWAEQREMMAKLQLEWLEKTLNQSTSDWLIVAGHYPVFSGGEHGNTPELQEQVKPLLEKYKVDAYLCGHDHTLQHLRSDGVDYFVSGSGALVGEYNQLPQSLFGTTANGYTAHRISKKRMDISMNDKFGKTLYRTFVTPKRSSGIAEDVETELQDEEKRIKKDAVKVFKII